jgi:hypothetical protein
MKELKIIMLTFKFPYFILVIFFTFQSVSHAYIDPGTGSFIIQALLAVFASIVFYLGYPIRVLKNFFKKIKKNKKKI